MKVKLSLCSAQWYPTTGLILGLVTLVTATRDPTTQLGQVFLLQLHLIGALLLTLELVEELASILVWALRNSCVGGGEECFLLLGFLVLIWEINMVVVVT